MQTPAITLAAWHVWESAASMPGVVSVLLAALQERGCISKADLQDKIFELSIGVVTSVPCASAVLPTALH